MKRIHIVGRKNSGKTSLVVELVQHLTAAGYRVGTIKHTHHRHELDTPGKDSYLHRHAGASVVGIISPRLTAAFWAADPAEQRDPYESLESVFADCHIVLVEGHSKTSAPKIEVWRAATGMEPIAAEDSSVRAIVSDDEVPVSLPTWPRSQVAELARIVVQLASDT